MKRKEFVEAFIRLVGEGRKRYFPNMRPAERAAAAVDDMYFAQEHWRKHRDALAAMAVAEWEASQGAMLIEEWMPQRNQESL